MSMKEYIESLVLEIKQLKGQSEVTDCDAVEITLLEQTVTTLNEKFSNYDVLVSKNNQMALKLKELGFTDDEISDVYNS